MSSDSPRNPPVPVPGSSSDPTIPEPGSNNSSWIPSFFHQRSSVLVDNEETPLLPDSSKTFCSQSLTSQRDGESYIFSEESQSQLSEFLYLLKTSIPVILAYALQNSLQTTSVLIVGRISPQHLATAAFSYMFAMSTAWLIALGGTTALDTLCSSSFTGSKNPYELGILLQRAFVVLGGMYVLVAIIWWNSERIFLLLGQEGELSKDSALFLRSLIPGGLGYIYFECVKKYLQAQGIMRAGTYVLLITAPLNVALNYLFVYTWHFGLVGAPLATGISYWLNFIGVLGYAKFVKGWDAWGGWSRECLCRMGVFARLAALGFIQVGTEWWAFEIVALAAGRLGTVPLASQSVIMTTDQVLNTIPFGIGVAASTRVGNMLGARSARGASRSANTAATLSAVAGAVVLVVLLCVKDVYAKIFSDDIEVVELTSKVMPYVALFQVADGLNGSCGGTLRGMGRQHTGAVVNIVSYYFGALPLGIYLAFYHEWGLEGLWIGQCIALYLVGAAEYLLVWVSNWDEQVRKAFERMEDEGERMERGGV
ncbi:mate-domain-containing protein [Tirmania nivea]|nr:mate-domain-containing protein [Tirmania nivea]